MIVKGQDVTGTEGSGARTSQGLDWPRPGHHRGQIAEGQAVAKLGWYETRMSGPRAILMARRLPIGVFGDQGG